MDIQIDNCCRELIEPMNMINTSAKKASNTTDILNTPIDNLINRLLARYKRTIFIECQKLKQKLEEGC